MRRPDHSLMARRRRLAPLLALSLFGVLALGSAPSAIGAAPDPDQLRKNSLDNQIAQSKADLAHISSSLVTANSNLAATATALTGARATLSAAEQAQANADAANQQALTELEIARANEAKAVAELKATRAEIADSRDRVADFAGQIYMDQGLGALSVAMDSQSPGDFAERLSMVGTVMDVAQQNMQDLSTAEAAQGAQEDHLSALRSDSALAQGRAQQALAVATSARDAAAQAKASLEGLQTRQVAAAADLESQKAAEQKSLQDMQVESGRLRAVLAARAAAAAKAAAAAAAKARAEGRAPAVNPSGSFLSAAELNQPITSEYGSRFHPILRIWRMHTGMDFGGPCGTPIYAAGPGTIISAGWAGGYGNRIVIDHGYVKGVGLATTYNHLQSIARSGGAVSRGQLIGYEGTTGMSTGCHLHFEVLENGNFVNPRKWL